MERLRLAGVKVGQVGGASWMGEGLQLELWLGGDWLGVRESWWQEELEAGLGFGSGSGSGLGLGL